MKVPIDLTPWPKDKLAKRVSVNSYGYGGANVHIICDDVDSYLQAHAGFIGVCNRPINRKGFLLPHGPPADLQKAALNRPYLLSFSAKSGACLKSYIKQLATLLKKKTCSDSLLPDLAYTLGVRRTALSIKAYRVLSASTTPPFVDQLAEFADDAQCCQEVSGESKRRIAFVFTGQGAQWARMGVGLLSVFPLTLRTLERLDEALKGLPDAPEWNLRGTD